MTDDFENLMCSPFSEQKNEESTLFFSVGIETEKTGASNFDNSAPLLLDQPKADLGNEDIEDVYKDSNKEKSQSENKTIIYEGSPPQPSEKNKIKSRKKKGDDSNGKKPSIKRGRKKKGDVSDGKKLSIKRKDNKRTKIKTHFLGFLISFINGIIKGGLFRIHNIKFRKISYQQVLKNTIEINYDLLQNKTVRDLFNFPVSLRYKNKQEFNFKSLIRLTQRLEKKKKEDEMNHLCLDKYKKIENFFNTTLKDIYKLFFLSKNKDKIIEEYQISKKCLEKEKIIFFFELIEKLRETEVEYYVNDLETEGLNYIENNEKRMQEKGFI